MAAEVKEETPAEAEPKQEVETAQEATAAPAEDSAPLVEDEKLAPAKVQSRSLSQHPAVHGMLCR